MEPIQFERLVKQAVAQLPDQFKRHLDNVDIVVEDYPNLSQLASVGLRHPLSLFGLYQGIPKTRRGSGYMFVAPDKITIFRLPIAYFYRTPDRIQAKIRAVILHEIGHHFGLSEADLARHPKAR